jgi:ABC-type glycerol-3-phosphate transport system substrate-binding protein
MTGGTSITKDADTKTPTVAANTATAKVTLAVLKTLVDEKLVPDGAATTKDENVDPNFQSGKLVMLLASAGAQTPITIYNAAKKGDIKGFACDFYQMPSPTGKTDPKVVSFGTSGFELFINKNDPDIIQGAKDAMVVWYETPSISQEMALKGGSSIVSTNVTLDYGDATLNEQVKRANDFNAKYATSDFGILTAWWSPFRETFYVQLQAYLTGTKTVDQMLADWETTGNAAIAKAIAAAK